MAAASTLLAIETSSSTGTVALAVGDAIVERTIATPREQTARVLEIVDDLLAEAGLSLAGLDALVFGQGPGSFTGLRVAAAVVQGLALASERPIVPASSIAALALRGLVSDTDSAITDSAIGTTALCCIDARMGEVYFGLFRLDSGLAVVVGEVQLGPPAAVRAPGAPYVAIGDGFAAGAAAGAAPGAGPGVAAGAGLTGAARTGAAATPLESIARGAIRVEPDLVPRARDLLPEARAAVAAGRFVPIEAALPVYLRGPEAWRRS